MEKEVGCVRPPLDSSQLLLLCFSVKSLKQRFAMKLWVLANGNVHREEEEIFHAKIVARHAL